MYDVYFFIIMLLALFISIVIHEVSHGYVAYKLGDPTAARLGRLSFNPIKHFDLLGSFLVPGLFYLAQLPLLGWAKPVPVDYSLLKKPNRDMMLIALAGPLSNIFLFVIFSFVFKYLLSNFYSNQFVYAIFFIIYGSNKYYFSLVQFNTYTSIGWIKGYYSLLSQKMAAFFT